MKLKFFKQLTCNHRWEKAPSFHQLYKDDDKVLWICPDCKKLIERERWNPPVKN